MQSKGKYFIGDMSKICNVSRKALRYYDSIGLISSQRHGWNNYRYYTEDSLLAVPVIKYYKQMGFTLEEMRSFIEGKGPNVYGSMQKSFLAKIEEIRHEQEQLRRKHDSVKDWYDLIVEAEMVIENTICEVSVKYIEPVPLLFHEQEYAGNLRASIINIEFTNYVESQHNEITGPVILNFSSFAGRLQDRPQKIRVLQKTLMPCPEGTKVTFGGCMMATCYHIGPHEELPETYKKICRWARAQGYALGADSYERYVTDYWTTRNSAQFVTEVMLRVSRGQAPCDCGDRAEGECPE